MLATGEAWLAVDDLRRKYKIFAATYYKLRNKYSGINMSELKQLKELDVENRRLKRMYADLAAIQKSEKDKSLLITKLQLEQSFLKNDKVSNGTFNSVKPDVYYEEDGWVFDYKFGEAAVSDAQKDKCRQNLPKYTSFDDIREDL